ncbi:TPA: hypothetical protein IWQ27_002382 [Enterococcus faecium]|nr:hypothetical protein [Enterococcus faecium]
MAEEDETVRIILGAGKSSIRHAYSLLKKHYDSKGKVPNFTDSELLNESLSNSNVAIKALHREYKKNGVDFLSRELPDGKTELLFHAKDRNMILATTEKVMRDMQANPQKYLKKEKAIQPDKGKKEPSLKDEIKIAKQEQQEMLKNVADKAVNKTLGKGKSI